MHYVYAHFAEYYRYHHPDTKSVPLCVAGIEAIRFIKLADALLYKEQNQGNFTFIEEDDDRVASYWDFTDRTQEWLRDLADRDRKIVKGSRK